VQNGLFWRCAPGRPDLLCPDGAAGEHAPACPPQFVGWPDGRHDRDVRPVQCGRRTLLARLRPAGR